MKSRKRGVGIVAMAGLMALTSTAGVTDTTGAAPARAATKGLVPDENLKIVERGADQRVWERKVTVPLPDGRTATETHRFTELATGMHVKQSDGLWKEASDEIVITPGGAALLGTRHKVYFPADIGKGVLRIVLPDGRELSSRPLGLGYSDGSQSVLIAELKSSVTGQLMPSKRQVVYPDAFVGVHADLVVSVSKSGLESDVVFREQPGTPESLQLNPATARLQVLTEWFGGIEPEKRLVSATAPMPVQTGVTSAIPVLPDTELSFGSMRMGAGKAFGTADGQPEGRGVRVSKSWTKLGSGRTFLTEEVPYPAVRRPLQNLPQKTASVGSKPFMALHSDSPDTPLPAARAIESGRGAIELAQAEVKQDGFVMDYVINLTVYNYGPFTFANNTTYYISDTVYAGWWDEPITLEGGAVIKFADSGSISLVGPLTCKTAPYRPAVFTSENDLSVGEPVGYGTPTRGTGTYLYDYGGNAMLHHVRFAYAGTAWDTTVGFDAEFWHCQFVNCGTAVYRESTGNNSFYNVLASHCGTLLNTPDYSSLYGEHLTLDYCGSFGVASATLVNTLITGDNGNNLDLVGQDLSWVTMGSSYQDNTGNDYQTRGGGKYYLASESGYRNAGTASINSQLMTDLGKLTTYPPAVYESATLDTVQTLGPQAPRGGLDIGYHYDPLDYVFAGTDVTTNLTFEPGTVVGWYRTSQGWQHAGHGIHLGDNVTLTFDGRADAPTFWVRCNTVVEADNQLYYGPGGITGWATNAANAPSLVARFTRFSMLGSEWASHYRDDSGYLKIAATHSEFWGGGVGSYASEHNYTNCLFDRAWISLQGSNTALLSLSMRNCTMIGGELGTHHSNSAAWPQSISDCVFDGTTITYSGLTTADADYNAFLTGANRVSPQGAHDQVLNSFDWQSGLFGNYYLPSVSPLIDAGSRRADAAGLFHFTTQADQAGQAKEATSVVDLGHHYAAANLSGLPTDADGDDFPDFLEDANGNGLADNGEAAWDGDSDSDDLPDSWEWMHFGDLSQDANGYYDFDEISNGDEFANGTDPNSILLAAHYTNLYVNQQGFSGDIELQAGEPSQMAVLVNSTNYAGATWMPYNSNFSGSLGSTDGVYTVTVALRGRTQVFPPAWEETEITLDRVAPLLVVTNPVAGTATVTRAYLQLQGRANEPLSDLTFDVLNAAGLLTNELGQVVGQHFDTNLFDFTTNYFQCYDVELANGTNMITLHASDRAGNVTSTNVVVVLDYSSVTSPPAIEVAWPPDGGLISGTQFTVRGTLDDETASVTAQIVDDENNTNAVAGVVERNGKFWIENLPLGNGENVVTITATNGAGFGTNFTLGVARSDVTLTVYAPQDESLYQARVFVSGTLDATDYTIYVNGQEMDTFDNGVGGLNWQSHEVPVYGEGTATFEVEAWPTGGGQAALDEAPNGEYFVSTMWVAAGPPPPVLVALNVEKPAYIALIEYHATKTFSYTSLVTNFFNYRRVKEYEAAYQADASGAWRSNYHGIITENYEYGGGWSKYVYDWTNTARSTQFTNSAGQASFTNIIDETYTQITGVPDQDLSYPGQPGELPPQPPIFTTNYYAGGVHHHWDESEGGPADLRLRAHTEQRLFTGGKAAINGKSLFHLTASATEYGRPAVAPWIFTPERPVDATKIKVFGWWLFGRHFDNAGELYLTLPDNSVKDLNLRIPSVKHYNADVGITKHKLVSSTVHPALGNTNLNRTTLGVGEEVVVYLDPAPPTNGAWTTTSGGLATPSATANFFTAPSNAATATVSVKVANADPLKLKFTVLEPTGVSHAVIVATNISADVPEATFGLGDAGAAMQLTVFMRPTNVSFYRVIMMEVGENASNPTGYFTNNAPLSHIGNGADQEFRLTVTNSWGLDVNGNGYDYCWYRVPNGGWALGSFTWNVPWRWGVADAFGSGRITNLVTSGWQQVFNIDASGTFKVTKFGSYWVQRTTGNVITNSPPH